VAIISNGRGARLMLVHKELVKSRRDVENTLEFF
jgi:hypothetical protein